MFNASYSVRLFLFNLAVIIMAGVWLSGFDRVHWFIYVVPLFLTAAAVTGFCPGLFISKKILASFGIRE
jgi:ABC-type polysaccharide/polyol phosphate export permease